MVLVSLTPSGGFVTWVGASSLVAHSRIGLLRCVAPVALALGASPEAFELVHGLGNEGVREGGFGCHADLGLPLNAFLNLNRLVDK